MKARFGFCMLALLGSVFAASTARAAPGEPNPADPAPGEDTRTYADRDNATALATGHSAQVVLAGPAGRSAELGDLIEELLGAEAITPHFSRIGGVRRAALIDLAARPSSSEARVWVTLSGPNLALLLFAGPSGQRYLVRQVPLRSGLDELGRERIAQVLQSSLLTLLRGEAGISRAEMRVAVERCEEAAPLTPPSLAAPAGVSHAKAPPRQALPAQPFASPRFGLGYAAAWTGHALRARHGPALFVGLDQVAGTRFHVGLAFERDFDQTYRSSLVGVVAQTTSCRLMLGAEWPLGGTLGLYARAGAGLDATRIAPTKTPESTARLRSRLTDFAAVSRAELGVALEVGPFVLEMGPHIGVSLADTHYDLAYDGRERRMVTPWPALPGIQLSGAWRPWRPGKPSADDSRAPSGSTLASLDTDWP